MVARVTAGQADSNGSLPPGLWLTSPAGWLPRTGIISETSVIEYGLPLPCFYFIDHSAGVERKLTSDNRLPLIIVMVRRRTMAARQFPILALYSTHWKDCSSPSTPQLMKSRHHHNLLEESVVWQQCYRLQAHISDKLNNCPMMQDLSRTVYRYFWAYPCSFSVFCLLFSFWFSAVD